MTTIIALLFFFFVANKWPIIRLLEKKNRISFNAWQLSVLEANFSRQQYITQVQRTSLAQLLGITELQVKVWFQNRRIRWRRDMKLNQASTS